MEILSEEIFGIYTPMKSGVREKRGDRVVVSERFDSNHPGSVVNVSVCRILTLYCWASELRTVDASPSEK